MARMIGSRSEGLREQTPRCILGPARVYAALTAEEGGVEIGFSPGTLPMTRVRQEWRGGIEHLLVGLRRLNGTGNPEFTCSSASAVIRADGTVALDWNERVDPPSMDYWTMLVGPYLIALLHEGAPRGYEEIDVPDHDDGFFRDHIDYVRSVDAFPVPWYWAVLGKDEQVDPNRVKQFAADRVHAWIRRASNILAAEVTTMAAAVIAVDRSHVVLRNGGGKSVITVPESAEILVQPGETLAPFTRVFRMEPQPLRRNDYYWMTRREIAFAEACAPRVPGRKVVPVQWLEPGRTEDVEAVLEMLPVLIKDRSDGVGSVARNVHVVRNINSLGTRKEIEASWPV